MSNESPRLLTTKDAAAILSCSPRTLEAWRRRRDDDGRPAPIGPAFVRVGGRTMYEHDRVLAYLDLRRVDPHAAAA
jgi:hypothetical protein